MVTPVGVQAIQGGGVEKGGAVYKTARAHQGVSTEKTVDKKVPLLKPGPRDSSQVSNTRITNIHSRNIV